MTDRDEFNKIVTETVAELLKMDVDTYNRVKMFAFTDRNEIIPAAFQEELY